MKSSVSVVRTTSVARTAAAHFSLRSAIAHACCVVAIVALTGCRISDNGTTPPEQPLVITPSPQANNDPVAEVPLPIAETPSPDVTPPVPPAPDDSTPPPAPEVPPKAYLFAPQLSTNITSVFDLNTHELVANIGLNGRAACCAYTRPDGNKVFVLHSLDPHISVIDVNSLSGDAPLVESAKISGIGGERGAELPKYGTQFWFSLLSFNGFINGIFDHGDLQAINSTTYEVEQTCSGVGVTFAISPDSQWIYSVATRTDGGAVNVFSVADSCKKVASVAVPKQLMDNGAGESKEASRWVAINTVLSPDGNKLYFGYLGNPGLFTPGYFEVVDVSDPMNPKFIKHVPVGKLPMIAGFTPDGTQLWVPNAADGTVTVIDVATDTVVDTIKTGRYVGNVGFWKDRAYLAFIDDRGVKGGALAALYRTVIAPALGGITAPTDGQTEPRDIDLPGVIVAYDLHSRKPIVGLPPMKTPSNTISMAIAVPTAPAE